MYRLKNINLKSWVLILGLTFSSILAQTFRQVRPEFLGMSSERLERLTHQLDSYVSDKKLPGGVALVLRKGKAAYFYSFGYRDRELMDAMEKDDIFRIASQTKAIISVGIMILQEKGLLLIQEPVGKYISEYNNTTVAELNESGSYDVVNAKRKITIRDLLTHTAGIGWGFGPAKDRWEKAEIIGQNDVRMIIKEFRNKVLESRRRLLIKKAYDLGGTEFVNKWVDLHVVGEKRDSLVQIAKEFGLS